MFLDSKFKAVQQPLCQYLCLLIAIVGFYASSDLQLACGQQVQQSGVPVVQQPATQIYQSPTYQSPTYRGPIYQTPNTFYQNQGGIQQQPVPATPIYQAPAGGVQTVPPVAQRVQQPRQATAQQIQDAEQAAYNAEKLALVEKLLEKYKATDAENQVAIKQLESLKQTNAELVKRMGEFDQTTKSYQTQVRDLEEKLSAVGKADPAMFQETEKLKASYQGVVSQVSDLESKIQTLSGENENYLGQIASLKAAQQEAMNSQPVESNQAELTEKNQQLAADKRALEQTNQKLEQEYTTLKGQYQEMSRQKQQVLNEKQMALNEKQMLSDLNAKLNAAATANNNFNAGSVSGLAPTNAVVPEPITPEPIATEPFDVSSYEAEISELTSQNRQLSESNSDFEDENRSLSRQLASLKNQSGDKPVDVNASSIATASLPAVLPAAVASAASGNEGGWGILAWLIPFLAIGLGVAFFVIIKEELLRPPAAATAKNKPNRRD